MLAMLLFRKCCFPIILIQLLLRFGKKSHRQHRQRFSASGFFHRHFGEKRQIALPNL
jgi:hypothetical protein